jgi:putative intracellular protease/amidase
MLVAVVVCGGHGYNEFIGDRPAAVATRQLLKDLLARDRLMFGSCDGANVLADAGVLRGREATTIPQNQGNVEMNGGTYVDDRVVVRSEGAITARTAQDARELVEGLVRATSK